MTSDMSGTPRLQPAPERRVSALQCYLAYATALLAGVIAWRFFQSWEVFSSVYWVGFAVSCVATVVIWIFSIANNNSSIYDPYWVIAPPIIAGAIKATAGGGLLGAWSARQVIVMVALITWACRYHIFYSWSGWRTGLVHEDWRYERMRSAPVPYWINSLFGMHLFPTVLVLFAFAPAAHLLASDPLAQPALGLWDILGVIAAFSAVAIQLVADRQLAVYRLTAEYRRGNSFRGGLWNLSRHPNYFGEVLFWAATVPLAVSAGVLRGNLALLIGGPIAMAAFFRFSCWLMDVRSAERRNDYQVIMNEVSAMVPWFPVDRHDRRRRSPAR